MTDVITDVEQITPEWLTEVLHQRGSLVAGHVRSLHKSTSVSPTCIMCRLSLEYTPDTPTGAPAHLFLKFARPGRDPLLLARVGQREVEMYRRFAESPIELPVLRCYDAQYISGSSTYHLLFDDLSLTHDQPASCQSIADHYMTQTVDCLAALHAYWWEHPLLGNGIGDLSSPDSLTHFHSHWWEQLRNTLSLEQLSPEMKLHAEIQTLQNAFPNFADTLGERLSPINCTIYEQVLASLPTFWDASLTIASKTLVHGDAHFWNILYPCNSQQHRPALFDWQTYHIGPGTTDLAHVIILRYSQRTLTNERALVRRYHDGLIAHGVAGYSWDACWYDYRRSAIEQLLFPLRWFARHY